MAGAAFTTTLPKLVQFKTYVGNYAIKSAEVVNQCDLVGLDTNGQVVVASQSGGSVIEAIGFAVFTDEHGGASSRTGVAGLTVTTSVYKEGVITNLNSTLVPSISKQGLPVLLGALTTATVSNYTCAISTTNTDSVQPVGVTRDATTIVVKVEPSILVAQTAGASTLKQG